jgi:nitroimidazol reductase NimA-like FMN-containing flavoprotein (pyridoxamine 5'-phosphate oxidase superfamily)
MMLGGLTTEEMDQLLRRQQIGRLGVSGDGRVFIFPIAYGYDGTCLYGHSQLGLKVRLMRQHPEVCVEVEEIESPARWRTVLVHGRYEELWDQPSRDEAFATIAGQGEPTAPLSLAPYSGPMETLIVYRIRVTEITGRFEHDAVLRAARAGVR